MFLYLSPKKTAVVKKSQQKRDNERREAEAKEAERKSRETADDAETTDDTPANGGLFANIKGGEELLKKLKEES